MTKMKNFTIRLKPEIYKKLQIVAEKQKLPVSNIIRQLIEDFLNSK